MRPNNVYESTKVRILVCPCLVTSVSRRFLLLFEILVVVLFVDHPSPLHGSVVQAGGGGSICGGTVGVVAAATTAAARGGILGGYSCCHECAHASPPTALQQNLIQGVGETGT